MVHFFCSDMAGFKFWIPVTVVNFGYGHLTIVWI
jgi:hypothetical protein